MISAKERLKLIKFLGENHFIYESTHYYIINIYTVCNAFGFMNNFNIFRKNIFAQITSIFLKISSGA